jgi:xylulokinase
MEVTPVRDVFLGIDLGTSSVKAVAVDESSTVIATAHRTYAVERPHPLWAEQSPEGWWRATVQAVRELLLGGQDLNVVSVGLSGQMHGLVLIAGNGEVLRPAIIWSDSRTGAQLDDWRERIGADEVLRTTGFPIAAGMFGVSLQWVRDNEPDIYGAASVAFTPKDYLRFRLTGLIGTEPTDAGATLVYDLRHGGPATNILDAVSLRADLLPASIPSLRIAGVVTAEASAETGLPAGTAVAAGGGDQAMAALALGLNDPSRAAVAISSGGTVIKPTRRPLDATTGLHVMPHAVAGTWLAMGVVLSAGLGMDWLSTQLFGRERSSSEIARLMAEAELVDPGAEGLLFSSNLGGTRTPVVDSSVRASIIGLGFQHTQAHVARAMVEGVCVELNRSLESMTESGESIRDLVISGGGARSSLWRQTLSDVTGLPVHVSSDLEHSALGAAFAGAIAVERELVVDFSERIHETVYPDPDRVELYRHLATDLSRVEQALENRKEVPA